MPTYIICSTDNDDYGNIEHIDLQPHFSALDATVAVTNVNTLANFQVLSEDDFIEFDFTYGKEQPTLYTLYGVNHQGMAWESIAQILNPIFHRSGIDIQVTMSDLHRIMFVSQQNFAITKMTYNFQIMLGFISSWKPTEAIVAQEYKFWTSYKSPEAPYHKPFEPQFTDQYYPPYQSNRGFWTWREEDDKSMNRNICAIPVFVGCDTIGALANGYRLQYDIKEWMYPLAEDGKTPERDWCIINPDNGTIVMNSGLKVEPRRWCKIRCCLYLGNETTPYYIKETEFHVVKKDDGYEMKDIPYAFNAKPILVFGEQTRISLQSQSYINDQGTYEHAPFYDFDPDTKTPWHIEDTSVIHFAGHDISVHDIEDDGWSCVIEAGTTPTSASKKASVWVRVNNEFESWLKFEDIKIVNDQVEVRRLRAEAPAVGNGLSTSQLYLLSNCGSDMYQNTLYDPANPRALQNARVAAIINNSFSAGYPILAGGEPPARVSTMDVSNLSYRLVDGNFRPLRLLNPMYITIQVLPVDNNTNTDITPFQGKLPKDKPTMRELAKQQEEAMQAQVQQMQLAEGEKEKMDKLMSKLTPAQQLQLLALPPDKQEYFRTYSERVAHQQRMNAVEEQQMMQQLAMTAPERMDALQRLIYEFLPDQQKAKMLAQQAAGEVKDFKIQQTMIQRAREEQQEDAEVEDIDAQEQQKQQALQATVQGMQAKKDAEEAQKRQLTQELGDAPTTPS